MFTLEKKALAMLKIANAFALEIIKYNEANNVNIMETRTNRTSWKPKTQEASPVESDNGTSVVGNGEF